MQSLSLNIQLLSITGVLGFILLLVRLIMKGKLREEYAIVWIFCAAIFLLFSVWRDGLEQISLFMGVYYPPSLIFLFGFFAIIIFLVHLSIVVSKLQSQIKILTREIAFLKYQLDQKRNAEISSETPTP